MGWSMRLIFYFDNTYTHGPRFEVLDSSMVQYSMQCMQSQFSSSMLAAGAAGSCQQELHGAPLAVAVLRI